MTRSIAAEYLLVRRALGYKLVNHEWLIRDFLDTLEQNHTQKITVSAVSCCADFGQRNEWIFLRCQGWLLITIVDFIGPAVTECGVTAPAVVKALDVADDVAPGL